MLAVVFGSMPDHGVGSALDEDGCLAPSAPPHARQWEEDLLGLRVVDAGDVLAQRRAPEGRVRFVALFRDAEVAEPFAEVDLRELRAQWLSVAIPPPGYIPPPVEAEELSSTDADAAVYVCVECNKRFETYRALRVHLHAAHRVVSLVHRLVVCNQCPACRSTSSCRQGAQHHLVRSVRSGTCVTDRADLPHPVEPPRELVCPACPDLAFDMLAALQTHLVSHIPEPPSVHFRWTSSDSDGGVAPAEARGRGRGRAVELEGGRRAKSPKHDRGSASSLAGAAAGGGGGVATALALAAGGRPTQQGGGGRRRRGGGGRGGGTTKTLVALTSRLADQVAALEPAVYDTFLVPTAGVPASELMKMLKTTAQDYGAACRAQGRGHRLGPPEIHFMMAFLEWAAGRTEGSDQAGFCSFREALQTKDIVDAASVVRHFQLLPCFSEGHVKLKLALDEGYMAERRAMVALLVKEGAERKVGRAPRGATSAACGARCRSGATTTEDEDGAAAGRAAEWSRGGGCGALSRGGGGGADFACAEEAGERPGGSGVRAEVGHASRP